MILLELNKGMQTIIMTCGQLETTLYPLYFNIYLCKC